MRVVFSPLRVVLFLFGCVILVSQNGCGRDMTPTGPEQGAVQSYLDENPDVAARLDEDTEENEDDDDGSGE